MLISNTISLASLKWRNWVWGQILLGVCLLFLSGCGGSSGSSKLSTNEVGKGRVQMVVTWPAPPSKVVVGRYIPPYALSLYFEMYQAGTPDQRYTVLAVRPPSLPATQTVAFDYLIPAGDYTLASTARANKDGTGATYASAVTTVTVTAGQTFTANLTLASTIKSMQILGQPLRVQVGGTQQLNGQALDPDGKTVVIPGDGLTWTLVSGSGIGTISPTGLFKATATGTARVKLSEVGAGISAQADITVFAQGSGTGLATSAWPKYRADAANSGRGQGSGATGKIFWKVLARSLDSSGYFSGSEAPVFGPDGTLYVSTGSGLTAVNPISGAALWTVPLTVSVSGGFSSDGGTPAIAADGTIYVSGYYLSAIDPATHTVKWSVPGPGKAKPNSFGQQPGPALGPDGTVFSVSGPGLTAFDGTNGAVKWTFTGQGGMGASPALSSDGTLYIGSSRGGSGGKVYAIDSKTGSQKWAFDLQGYDIEQAPCIGPDGTVFVGASGPGVFALNPITGAKKWFFSIGSQIGTGGPFAVSLDNIVYVPTEYGQMIAIDGATGAFKWGYNVQGHPFHCAPLIATDGVVYVGCDDGNLYAFNGKTGSVNWTLPIGSNIQGSPAMGLDGALYFATGGNLYSIH